MLHAGDCFATLRGLADCSIDSIVTDPPYALVSVGKRFGGDGAAPAQFGRDGAYQRASAGFMGKKWDTGETAFSALFWAECLRVLKPGGYVAAFGGTRTYHRLACAIEDAGFEIRDQLGWVTGQGFPKSLDISKAIDKAAGVKRTEVVGKSARHGGGVVGNGTSYEVSPEVPMLMAPATDAARQWEGWGTALKPAWEPICLARKPLSEGTNVANVLLWSTGALNIDKCRIPSPAEEAAQEARRLCPVHGMCGVPSANLAMEIAGSASKNSDDLQPSVPVSDDEGRKQSSVDVGELAEHNGLSVAARGSSLGTGFSVSAETVAARVPGASTGDGEALREGAGATRERSSHQREESRQSLREFGADRLGGTRASAFQDRADDDGANDRERSAARCTCGGKPSAVSGTSIGRFPANILHDGSDEVVAAFPDTKSRANKNSSMSLSEGLHVYGKQTPRECGDRFNYDAGGSAARFFYAAKASKADRAGSKHPTIKPISLMRWLCRLVTPPGGTVLDPFAGSGTTGQAALEEGFRVVLCEREAEYLEDIRRRLGGAA